MKNGGFELIIRRNLANKLEKLLKFFPVVAVVGARQVGKTTLVRSFAPDWYYLDLEKPEDYDRAVHDPQLLFEQHPRQLIIDEAQILPELFNVLRGVIDAKREEKGRFIITGSSSMRLLTQISESLAGRIAIIELEPLKANEYYQIPLSPFYKFLCGHMLVDELLSYQPPISHQQLQYFWLKGGYPEPLLHQENEFGLLWMQQYRDTYINRDLAMLFPKLNKIKYQRFVAMLSQLSSTIINRSDLARTLEIDEKTVREYLKIAEGTFIWRELLSYENSFVKSIVKMPKGHIRDSGLLNNFLRINSIEKLYENPIVGRSFEAFVTEEIIKGLSATMETNWNAFYYRTRSGVEVDLILQGNFGVIPIEIKYGTYTSLKQLKNLSQFIAENNIPYGIIINQSSEARWVNDHIFQLPITWL
jgi:predicted AAA+ superfamily ATPase